MYPVYNTGRVWNQSNTGSGVLPVILNPNNKGVLIIPATSGSAADCNLKLMGPDGMEAPGGVVAVDGSADIIPYHIPITVHSITAAISNGCELVELF